MKDKQTIYTDGFTQSAKRQSVKALTVYAIASVLFAALCVAFCLLAAFDKVNVYVCCTVNVVLSVAYAWYCYLFFTVWFKPVIDKLRFVKRLNNALPVLAEGVYVSAEQSEQYLTLRFDVGEYLLDKQVANPFKEGVKYNIELVNGTVVSYAEVDDER